MLELAYIADRGINDEPIEFVFKTSNNDYYLVNKIVHDVGLMGSLLSDLLRWEIPTPEDYSKAFDTQKWLEKKLDSGDTKDIGIHVMGSEFKEKYNCNENNIKFTY